MLGDQASKLHQLYSGGSILAWFRFLSSRPPGCCHLRAWWPPAFFLLQLQWFSDIESGASISSVFWQSDLTSLEWFRGTVSIWSSDSGWELNSSFPCWRKRELPCWRVGRLTPDLFLPAALANGHHVLLELPTVTAHEAHSSVTEK